MKQTTIRKRQAIPIRALLLAAWLAIVPAFATTPQKPNDDAATPAEQEPSTQEGATMLSVGTTAPDFVAKDHEGNEVRLSDFKGQNNVILIFYPKDDTPVCTAQLCEARDAQEALERANVKVFGINTDSADSHKRFAEKHRLSFPLLVDADKTIIRAYGVKGMLFIQRTVYGIDKEGQIVFAERGKPSLDKVLAAFSP